MKIHLDFETRSEADIKKVGAWVYSKHPSTEILCMAWGINNETIEIVTKKQLETPYPQITEIVSNKNPFFVAHSAFFEYVIWLNILVERFKYPKIPLENWRCTAAKASALALPRGLDQLAQALELPYKKDMEGRTVMLRMCKPRKPTKEEKDYYKKLSQPIPVLWHEKPEDYEKLYQYCMKDVEVGRSADNVMRDLSPRELEIFQANMKLNIRGLKTDVQVIDNAIRMINEHSNSLINEVKIISNGELDGLSKRQAALTWIKGEGIDLPDFTKETVNEVLNKELPPHVRRVLELRQELGKTSLAKYNAFKYSVDIDGIIRDLLIYHGAATGRDTGQRMQLHNLPRITSIENIHEAVQLLKEGNLSRFKNKFPNVLGTLSQMLRCLLIPREGYKLVGADWNAIEVRLLFWFAKETKGLNQYENNEDLYKFMATKIFGVVVERITKMQRYVGKQTVLGSGYGMGLNGERFVATCRQQGVTVPIELAKAAIRTYRNTYTRVVDFWKKVELAVIDAIKTKKIIKLNNLIFFTHGGFLYIQLPSKRMLAYHKPLLEGHVITHMGWNTETRRYERQRTWGGTLVENIVQGTARDVLVEGRKAVEKKGYIYVLSIHDELLTETRTGNAQEFKNILHVKPEWIGDYPLKVEAWEGDRFGIK